MAAQLELAAQWNQALIVHRLNRTLVFVFILFTFIEFPRLWLHQILRNNIFTSYKYSNAIRMKTTLAKNTFHFHSPFRFRKAKMWLNCLWLLLASMVGILQWLTVNSRNPSNWLNVSRQCFVSQWKSVNIVVFTFIFLLKFSMLLQLQKIDHKKLFFRTLKSMAIDSIVRKHRRLVCH